MFTAITYLYTVHDSALSLLYSYQCKVINDIISFHSTRAMA